MDFKFPRVVKKIECGEYAPEMSETVVAVWVNVPTRLLLSTDELNAMKDEELFAWLREVWSPQGDECSLEDVQGLWEHCKENDPRLWGWLVSRTMLLLFDYRIGQKKA